MLSLLSSPTLTSLHDYWKNHGFDYMDFDQQSDVSTFQYAVYVYHSFPSKEQVPFNYMAAVILEPKKIKSIILSTLPPSIWPKPHGNHNKWVAAKILGAKRSSTWFPIVSGCMLTVFASQKTLGISSTPNKWGYKWKGALSVSGLDLC